MYRFLEYVKERGLEIREENRIRNKIDALKLSLRKGHDGLDFTGERPRTINWRYPQSNVKPQVLKCSDLILRAVNHQDLQESFGSNK